MKKNMNLWLSGAKGNSGIDYQRSAQITWWSILQGFAVAELIGKLPNILVNIFEKHEWFTILYIITTFMIIVNSWVQMAWAILILRWRINILHTILILILGISISFCCFFIESPKYWFLSVGATVLSAITIYSYNSQYDAITSSERKRVKQMKIIYFFFLIFCFTGAILLFLSNSLKTAYIWGFLVLIVAFFSLFLQQKQMNFERNFHKVP